MLERRAGVADVIDDEFQLAWINNWLSMNALWVMYIELYDWKQP